MESSTPASRCCFWRKAEARIWSDGERHFRPLSGRQGLGGGLCLGRRRASGHASVRVDWQGIRRSTTLDTDMFSYLDGPEGNLRRVTNRRAIDMGD